MVIKYLRNEEKSKGKILACTEKRIGDKMFEKCAVSSCLCTAAALPFSRAGGTSGTIIMYNNYRPSLDGCSTVHCMHWCSKSRK